MNAKENEGSGTHLFLVRLWPKEVNGNRDRDRDGSSEREWYGRVQHILSGEAHNFQGWSGLIELLLTMMPLLDAVQRHQRQETKQETEDER